MNVPLIFALVFVILGLVVSLISYRRLSVGRASTNWPSVPGQIISSEVKTIEHVAERKRAYVTYRAEISFGYDVNGRHWVSSQPLIDQPEKTYAAEARALVAKYPAGAGVRVYYDPANPSLSVLERGALPSTYVAFGFGLAVTLLGLALFGFKVFPRLAAANIAIRNGHNPDPGWG